MPASPSVHVLIPAYGPSPYLAEAVRSVLALAGEGIELTVVDDASPGDEVATVLAGLDAEVECVRLPQNLGVAGAFDACTRISRGDYTILVGSDDVLEPWYVEELRGLIDRFGHVEMAMPRVTVIDTDGAAHAPLADRVKRLLVPRGDGPQLLGGERLASSLLIGDWLYFPAIAWRTDVLRALSFRTDMGTAMDLDLALRIVFDGGRLALSPRPSFRYRRHADSVSSRTARSGERFAEERTLFAWAAARADSLGWRRAARAARWHVTSRLHVAVTAVRSHLPIGGGRGAA
jgi:glycosyltransferase involved in cell wall biosynthesis